MRTARDAASRRCAVRKDGLCQNIDYCSTHSRMRDVPSMHCKLIATDNAPTGAGQMTTPLVAPAIASAFHRLTRRRLRHMPFTPARVLETLKA